MAEETRTQSIARNRAWAKAGPYVTTLSPSEESRFQEWAGKHPDMVRDEMGDTPDYDVRGRWLADQHGDPDAKLVRSAFDGKLHASDKWKTPYHRTFSAQSIYATPDAPKWNGDVLKDKNGQVVADETPGSKATVQPEPDWDANDYRRNGVPVPANLASSRVAVFDPQGTVRMVPEDQLQQALAAGGVRAYKMADPNGTPRYIPEGSVDSALRNNGKLLEPGPAQTGQVLPPHTPIPAGARRASNGAPIPPQGMVERLYGKNPVTDTLANAAGHAAGAVTGPIEAFEAPADANDPAEQGIAAASGLLGAFGPTALGAYRMTAKPTVDALRNAVEQAKAGNYGVRFGGNYDDQGNYHPDMVSSLQDAIPFAGAPVRNFKNELHQKGLFPAVAGALTDFAAPHVISRVPMVPPMLRRAIQERIAPTKALDTPIPGDTVTPRERYIAARNQGVNLDAAQATGGSVPAMAKKLTDQSLRGGPRFAENNAANLDALHGHAQRMLDAIAQPMSREDFGNLMKQRLTEHRDLLRNQAGLEDYAQAALDGLSPNDMSREEFGNYAKGKLLEHQQSLMEQAGNIFDMLTKRAGTKQPDMGGVRAVAQGIIREKQPYYDLHPATMDSGTKRAWAIVHELAGDAPERAPRPTTRAAGAPAPVPTRAPLANRPDSQIAAGATRAGLDGSATSLLTPTQQLPAKYRVMEANDLVPSHNAQTFAPNPGYPEGVQERAYDTSKESQNRVIQQSQNYDPRYTVNSNPDAVNGPPVVTPDGVVLGGNSRAMSTQRHYAAGGKEYRQYLEKNAGQFGIDPQQLSGMKQPVLVRQVDAPGGLDQTRRIGSELNKSMIGSLGVSEKAVSAGKNLRPETLQRVSDMLNTDDSSLREMMGKRGDELVRMLTKDGVITERERPQYVDAQTGGLSEEGKTFVERALMGSVVDDPRLMDAAPKGVLQKLERSLGSVTAFAGRPDEWNILPAIRKALDEHATIAANGNTVENHLNQTSLFGGEARNPVVDAVVRKLGNKPSEVRDTLASFARDADQNQPGQPRMFGGGSPVDAFNHAFGTKLTEQEYADGLAQSTHSAPQSAPVASTEPAAAEPPNRASAGSDAGLRDSAAPRGAPVAGESSAGSVRQQPPPAAVVSSTARPDTWADLHQLRSDLMNHTRSPDIVGTTGEGYLKQLTAAVDNAMTGASSGLRPAQRAQFRQANDLYRQMKDQYDNPQSKLYHVVRAPDGLTAANMLADTTPEVARQVMQAGDAVDGPELTNQLRRQTVSRLLDPAGNGDFDLDGFAGRYAKAQKEKLGGVLLPEHMEALDGLAAKTQEAGPYDHPSSKLYKAINAQDGTAAADVLSRPTPETVRQIAKAGEDLGDPLMVPQLQRQTVSRILSPTENEVPDFKNLPSRFKREHKEQLGGVLTADQLGNLDDLARTSGAVTYDTNPSGTAKVLQPVGEVTSLAGGGTAAAPALMSGHPITAAVSAGVPIAATLVRGAVAKKMVDPAFTESLMAPRAPVPPAKLSQAAVGVQTGAMQQNDDQAITGIGGTEGNAGTPPPDKPGMTPLPPPGATHEVLSPDGSTVTGHVVDGQYVPLAAQTAGPN